MAVGIAELLAVLSSLGEGRYAVVGAVARNAWAPPRATTDVDLAVAASPDLLASAERTLESVGYRLVRRQQADPRDALPDLLIFRSESSFPRQVDFLVAKTEFEEQVLRRALPVEISRQSVRVATPEDLIVYKLLANRPRDLDDVDAIVLTQERGPRRIDWAHVERRTGESPSVPRPSASGSATRVPIGGLTNALEEPACW
jgi:hypothetical protein